MPDQPLRVLQVASTSLMGGAEQMMLALVCHADPARLCVGVLALMGDGPLPRLAAEAGALQGEGWRLRRLLDPRLPGRMKRFLAEGRYDIVHTYGLRAELVTRPAARALGMPLISSISSPDPWRKWYHVALDRWTAGAVTAWVSVCEAGRQIRIRRERFPAAKIHVVLNGIPDEPPVDAEARRRARKRWQVPEGAPTLAVIGNLRPAKGYPDLIEAVADLRRTRPDLVCLVAGRDDSAGEIPALARERGIESNIRWLGFVTDTRSVLAAADLAAISSHWEGCPINLLEAMRAGVPSVATRVGGIPELIESGCQGLIVEPHAPGELAQAIELLLADPDRRKALGEAARQRFVAQFTVERMVNRLTEIYEEYGKNASDRVK